MSSNRHSGDGRKEKRQNLLYREIHFESKNKPSSLVTSSIFFNWLLKSSSGNRLRATKLQNTFGCIIAHEKHICRANNLLCLSSIFQFPMWVKPKASPNLVGSWESIKQNRQKHTGVQLLWGVGLLCLGVSRPFSLLLNWQAQRAAPVLK